MTTREENRIRIVREIPLWGVITGLIAVLMMAGAAGKTHITNLGGGNAHVEFDHIDESGVAVAAEMTGSVCSDVTLTP